MVSPAVATIILRITLLNYDAKHLAKASSNRGDPLNRIFRRSKAPYQTTLLRYKAQPGAAVGRDLEICPVHVPSFTSTVSLRMIEDSFNFMRAVRLCRIEKGNSTIKG
jgi:hypothetical protein